MSAAGPMNNKCSIRQNCRRFKGKYSQNSVKYLPRYEKKRHVARRQQGRAPGILPGARLFFSTGQRGQMLFLRLRLIFATTSRTGTFIPVVIVASSIS